MNTLDTTIHGRQGAMNAEEEALQGIVQALHKCEFKPVLYCGSSKFSEILEILSSQQGMNRNKRRLFVKSAERCGYIVINAEQEKIDVRSGVAWNVEPLKYPIIRTSKLDRNEVLIQPYNPGAAH